MKSILNSQLIHSNQSIREALVKLNQLGEDLTLFVTDKNNQLIGSLTDGDIRRGLLQNKSIDEPVDKFMKKEFISIKKNSFKVSEIVSYREKEINTIPVVNDNNQITELINFSKFKSWLPVEVIIMAGGEGQRLRPLTERIPKPLLKIGDKPIIEHGIDQLISFGIKKFHISINYLGNAIRNYLGNGSDKNVSISYIEETEKLGTIGSARLCKEIEEKFVLICNSDLLTNINYEDLFLKFEQLQADLMVACIPYTINVPYAILDTSEDLVTGIKEKPNLNYYTNAGIYLLKKEVLNEIPGNQLFHATDLIDKLINAGKKVSYYPILGYWLDIGNMDDYKKAQIDIKHINI